MNRFTVEQYAGMINRMADQGLSFYLAGAVRDSRDLWRSPANMALLNDDAKQAARHYIKEENR